MMISLIGCLAGVVIGLVFCLLQLHYGWVKMGSQSSVIDAYPIAINFTDFILVF